LIWQWHPRKTCLESEMSQLSPKSPNRSLPWSDAAGKDTSSRKNTKVAMKLHHWGDVWGEVSKMMKVEVILMTIANGLSPKAQ
jgi:hypothetical protein